MRTLIIHNGGVGDFVLTCPSIAALTQKSEVVLAGVQERVELVVAAGKAKESVNLDSIGFHSVFSSPDERFRSFVKDFDRAIVWMEDKDGRIVKAFNDCGVGETQCFPGLPGVDYGKPAWQYYLECLGLPLGYPPRLDISPASNAPEIIIHPGSGGKKKCWPFEYFLMLANHLTEAGYQLQFCVGPAEEFQTFPEEIPVLPEMKLKELGAILASTKLYIGNDSGISHLAAAVGCPTIAIFGVTDPRIWAPSGPQVRILGGASNWPTFEQVLEEAKQLLNLDKTVDTSR